MRKLKMIATLLSCAAFAACNGIKTHDGNVNIEVIQNKLIDGETAKKWSDDYTDSRYKLIQEGLQFDDNRSSWYSVEELEAYIHYAKQQAQQKGYNLEGFRLHLAVNPDLSDRVFKKLQESYGRDKAKQEFERIKRAGGLTTIFIAPTGRDGEQRGSMFRSAQPSGTQDITNIDALEWGGAGDPPSDSYPASN